MKELVFFFDQPPKVGKGCFNAISKVWQEEVVYVYLNGFNETRKNTNWNDGDYGIATIIDLGKSSSVENTISHLFEKYSDAVFVLCGFKSKIVRLLDNYILSNQYKFICFAERPGVYGVWWKKLLKTVYVPLSEVHIAHKYRKYIKAFLPLGEKGVQTYHRYGWDKDTLFPFMYDPVNYIVENDICYPRNPMKLLYVGRFSKYTKGTDTLKKAIDLLSNIDEKFTLTLVGGYGDMREEMLSWVESHSNVEFLGVWDSKCVGPNMREYDICIVPSKFDGWNLLVNESLRANIGTIVTDEAVSDEVIKWSHSGVVVKSNDSKALANAIRNAVNKPDLVFQWKKNASTFSRQIDSNTVANYFISIVKYTFCEGMENRPECPWLMTPADFEKIL